MTTEVIQLDAFNNVVNTGLANCDLSKLFGYSIERLYLNLGGTFTKSNMTSVKLLANGKTIYDSDGSKIDARNAYRGVVTEAGWLLIDFLETGAKSDIALQSGGIDTTLGIKSLRLEVQITGATSPTLTGWAEVQRPLVDPNFAAIRPLVSRIHRSTQTIGAAGTFALEVPHLNPLNGGSVFKRVNVFSANMTGAEVIRNGMKEHISVKAFNDRRQKDYRLVPQASLYMLDFIVDNLQRERVLDTRPAANCHTAQVYGTFSAAETIVIEVEVLEPIDVY